MRRVMYLVLCLSGCLLIVLLVRARRAREQMPVARGPVEHERDPASQPSARVIPLGDRPAPAAAPAVEPEQTPPGLHVAMEAATPLVRPSSGDSGVDEETARRRRMADIRAEMADDISHGVLFSMAHERGVSGGLVVASRWDLLEAILRVEGLRAEDGCATTEEAERLDQLLREARQRDAEAKAVARELEAERTIQTRPPEERRSQYR